jgi:hypothetical protein
MTDLLAAAVGLPGTNDYYKFNNRPVQPLNDWSVLVSR